MISVRGFLAVWLLGLTLSLISAFAAAAESPAHPTFEIQMLPPGSPDATPADITSGSLDSKLQPFKLREQRKAGGAFWLKLVVAEAPPAAAESAPALLVRTGRHFQIDVYRVESAAASEASLPHVGTSPATLPSPRDDANAAPLATSATPATPIAISKLPLAATRPTFTGAHDAIFVLPSALASGQSLYVHVDPRGEGSEQLEFSTGPLDAALSYGAAHTRMITLAFGALMAMALTSLLIWFVLSDRMLIYYAVLFSMQALYIAYFSGQGFDWPFLSYALPLTSHAWNVPAAISGAAACMFVREIADLRSHWPRVHKIFGWFAAGFLVLAASNVLREFGLGGLVANIGNLLFLTSAVFTVVVASMAWWRGGRAAGFFLVAWGLLEAFTIAAAIRLLTSDATDSDFVLHIGLPLSMMAAAILIALGVADRLREQRRALSEAQRHAATDPLTGVLNRRSLIERLEAACSRAQSRDMPIALLFIDLDHFKQINDSYGHLAGDACLAAVVEPIKSELRQSDAIGRYGGEEFVVILSSANAKIAEGIAERIRERVSEVRVEGFGIPIRLTCSIGIAASDTLGVWGKHLIARADEAVYAAKRSGRNRVQMAEALAA